MISAMTTCALGAGQGFAADIANLINVKDYEVVNFDKKFRRLTTKSAYPNREDLNKIYTCGEGHVVFTGAQGVSIYQVGYGKASEIFKDYEYVNDGTFNDIKYYDKFTVGPECIASGNDFIVMSGSFNDNLIENGASGVVMFREGAYRTYPALVKINISDAGEQESKIICFSSSCRFDLESLNDLSLKATHMEILYRFTQEYTYFNHFDKNYISYRRLSDKLHPNNIFCLNFDRAFFEGTIDGVACKSHKIPSFIPSSDKMLEDFYLGSFGDVYKSIPNKGYYTYCALSINCEVVKLDNSENIYPKSLYKINGRWFLKASNFFPIIIDEDVYSRKLSSPYQNDVVNVFCDLGKLNMRKCYRFNSKKEFILHAFMSSNKWIIISTPIYSKNNEIHISMQL